MTNAISAFSLETRLDLPYERAVEKVIAALKQEGFGVLTEIDVKATLQQKLGVDFRKYVILGACNPPLAHQALSTDLNVGLFMPCNAVVYENDDGGSVVAIFDPAAMVNMAGLKELEAFMAEGRARLQRVIEALKR